MIDHEFSETRGYNRTTRDLPMALGLGILVSMYKDMLPARDTCDLFPEN